METKARKPEAVRAATPADDSTGAALEPVLDPARSALAEFAQVWVPARLIARARPRAEAG